MVALIVRSPVSSSGGPVGASRSSRSGAKLPSVPGGVERVAVAAVDLEEGLARLQVGGDLLRAARRVAVRAEGEPGDEDREENHQQPEDDEGLLAHFRAARYQGHIRRSCAVPAAGFRAAGLAAVADQVHVQLVGVLGVDDRQHLVVRLLEGGPFREEAETAADPVDVDVDRDLRDPPGEDQHAGRGFAAHPRQVEQELERLLARSPSRSSRGRAARRAARGSPGSAAPSACARPPGRIASSTSATGASRTSSQDGKRSRSAAKERSRLRSLVCWERTVLTSSAIGCRWGSLTGRPYISRSRSRIARTRRFVGRLQAIARTLDAPLLLKAATRPEVTAE